MTIDELEREARSAQEAARLMGDEFRPAFSASLVLDLIREIRSLREGDEPRNVRGMTRSEFENHLRICYQHDNVRAHVNAPGFKLTADQERAIAERVELNYPATKICPGCHAWDSGASEVRFVQGCEGCAENMRKIAGIRSTTN